MQYTHFSDLSKSHEKLWFFNFRPWMGATLCGPDFRNCFPFTLDNDFYRQVWCCRCIWSVILTLTFFRPFHKVTKNFDFSTSNLGWAPLCVDQISQTFCHLPWIMTSTDSWDAVDVHPICSIDLDICLTFPKGHKKHLFFNYTLDGCHFVGIRSQKLFAIHLTPFTNPFTPPTRPFAL